MSIDVGIVCTHTHTNSNAPEEVTLNISLLRMQLSYMSLHLSLTDWLTDHKNKPNTARVVGTPLMISHPVSSFFRVLHCPLGLGELRTCPFPDVVLSSLPLSALSSSPVHCALEDGFGQIWWMEQIAIPLQFASLYDRQEVFVWFICPLDLGTDFFAGNRAFVWDA